MNYKESRQILEEIKKAKKILISCHRGPDPDSIGSSLALYYFLTSLDKEVKVVCLSDVPDYCNYLPSFEVIRRIDYKRFDFSKYDLFIIPDSGSWDMVVGSDSIEQPQIASLVIDHHKTNKGFGKINLIDEKTSSTAEILYLMFKDLDIKITPDIATALLTGIIGDTGVFQFEGVGAKTLDIAKNLMELGANKDEIVLNIYNSYDFKLLGLLGEVLLRMEEDKKYKFVWSAIPFDIYNKHSRPESAKEVAATMFSRIVKETDFGMVMIEIKEKSLAISLRTRTGFDVSKLAEALGGGGHKNAAGAIIEGKGYEEAVEEVLQVARKLVKNK
ncbi:bifunctional oligoribonuclease/PAP phosphatase NrnA [Patescibacteria group bacterium]|nr:bifunctional oligoribonuclease/PAP phosphatase NrnA [Patescibacteria group bacterium]MBU0776927.1 bifunctional oligoribonuclease/PAP phosphatase NrnA [Patescibacteria group bacterium]MBU0845957.1 bifunctional oligoribonuclease/PAP phosphatase NrnA [Patescibacteria group bacterium]MBU0922506.1 bifunctional oligoribonuclease/PAP phosphatase NrnA [Patescibacteria group bacterium]MBU1066316.1 bifunctional oligoribonuclease/PAP phosphatase NrnA [Patescibacteria group bacterium]